MMVRIRHAKNVGQPEYLNVATDILPSPEDDLPDCEAPMPVIARGEPADVIVGGKDHRKVWEAAYGPIPDGYHIHHLDGDHYNNTLANLACMAPAEHTRWHAKHDHDKRLEKHLAKKLRVLGDLTRRRAG